MQNEKTTAPAPHHIAIIHTGAIGDLVQTGPLLAAVRAKWPEARVTLVGRPERGRLLEMAGLVDATVDAETSGLWRLAGDGGASGPLPRALAEADLVIDLLWRPGEKPWRGRIASLEPLPPEDWTRSAAAWLLEQAAGLELAAAAPEPVLAVPDAVRESARRALAAKGIRRAFAAIHPGSGSTKKNWAMERFGEVARRLREKTGRSVAWLLGPAEVERGTVPPAPKGEAVLADLALETVAGILALADGYVGNDSGVTQLAAAVRGAEGRATPTVALFGPTDVRVWAPRGRHVRVVRSPDGTMESIEPETVWSAVRAVLGEITPREKSKPRD
jgi:ADP-heptose:LPS heptosyltransferase